VPTENHPRPHHSEFKKNKPARGGKPQPERFKRDRARRDDTPERGPMQMGDFDNIDGAHYVFGRHAVLELLEKAPERVQKVYVSDQAGKDARLKQIIDHSETHKIRWQAVPRQKIDQIVFQFVDSFADGDDTFKPGMAQGVAAMVTAQPLLELETLIENAKATEHKLIIALDEVTDGRNIGAIMRVAEAAGASGLVLPKHRSGGLSPMASKTAVGADQTLPIAQVTNLAQSLETLKEAGYWLVGSVCETDVPKGVKTMVQDYQDVNYKNTPIVLLVGSEEKGLRQATIKHCDFLVNIPIYGQIQSLNVSTATAILAYEIAKQHRK
jgi:23S rRNA (guanosine2251-2'-O)-methyltransferase